MVPLDSNWSETIDMTIYWKALKELILMVPLVLRGSKHIVMTIQWKALGSIFQWYH
jgi:hypothetical protein